MDGVRDVTGRSRRRRRPVGAAERSEETSSSVTRGAEHPRHSSCSSRSALLQRDQRP
ncbi:hypothetical protein HBB16_19335 [Pseudonocardia sp. MCCB 268]|nr:hypothetical protein [Pseudonocardia cytotoxica]